MSTNSFDRLSRSLAARISRRQAVHTAGAGIATGVAVLVRNQASAQQATPATQHGEDRHTSFLFVQTFSAGTMAPHATDPDLYTLTLTGHAAETIYFSDRPERIVGSVPTPQFLEGLGFTPDIPPNAALVAGEQVVVMELMNPVYTETFGEDGTVTLYYDVRILADYAEEGLAHLAEQADGTLPESFDSASLFIDDCPDAPVYCKHPTKDLLGLFPTMGHCWDAGGFCCAPCASGDFGYWTNQCNLQFPACKGECRASDGGPWFCWN